MNHEQVPAFLGVDVGGTNIKLGCVLDNGEQVHTTSIPTEPNAAAESAIARIVDAVVTWGRGASYQIVGCGLGTPGPLDLRAGKLLTPVNLPGWHNFPIRDALADALQMPVTFANDANAAAYGEYWLGAARECRSCVLLTLGTGVGGGIVVNDWLVEGATGHGGECGHTAVDFGPDARMCPCGMPGHLEAYASATATAALAMERCRENPEASPVLAEALVKQGRLEAFDVYRAACIGDNMAVAIVDEVAGWLARGIANLVFTIDPEIVLLGGAMNFGGPSDAIGQRLLATIRTSVARSIYAPIAKALQIDFAMLGGAAGWIGAAGLARRRWQNGATD